MSPGWPLNAHMKLSCAVRSWCLQKVAHRDFVFGKTPIMASGKLVCMRVCVTHAQQLPRQQSTFSAALLKCST